MNYQSDYPKRNTLYFPFLQSLPDSLGTTTALLILSLLFALLLSACNTSQIKLYPTIDNFWTPGPDAGGSSYDFNAVGHGPEQNLVMVGEDFWDDYARNIVGLKFDLSKISANKSIISATLYLYLESADGENSTSIVAGTAPVDWEEDTETYAAGLTYCFENPSTSTSVGLLPGWVSWDVTDLVQQLLADPASDFGLCLERADTQYGWRIFTSREGETDQRPYLEIRYSSAP